MPAMIQQPDMTQAGDPLKTAADGEKKAGSPIFRRAKTPDEELRAAEDETFKGYVSDRKQALERIDKLLE
jgi:hypothetical protein